jgi:hypothetical protein
MIFSNSVKILTARHCIVGHAPSEALSVELIGIDPWTIERILIPKDSRRDMAVAVCRKPLECERHSLRLGTGFVLDEVMALGTRQSQVILTCSAPCEHELRASYPSIFAPRPATLQRPKNHISPP